MFWILLVATCGLVSSAKLHNQYLPPPPPTANEAGGTDLQPPLEPPYLDPYNNPNEGDLTNIQNNRGQGRPLNTIQPQDDRTNKQFKRKNTGKQNFLTNDDEIKHVRDTSFSKSDGKFISGSYSYKTPENVLVTVTYAAADEAENKTSRDYSDEEQEETNVF